MLNSETKEKLRKLVYEADTRSASARNRIESLRPLEALEDIRRAQVVLAKIIGILA